MFVFYITTVQSVELSHLIFVAGFAKAFTIQLVDDVHKIFEGYFYAFRTLFFRLTVHFVDEVQST